jgi:hypothetical protein
VYVLNVTIDGQGGVGQEAEALPVKYQLTRGDINYNHWLHFIGIIRIGLTPLEVSPFREVSLHRVMLQYLFFPDSEHRLYAVQVSPLSRIDYFKVRMWVENQINFSSQTHEACKEFWAAPPAPPVLSEGDDFFSNWMKSHMQSGSGFAQPATVFQVSLAAATRKSMIPTRWSDLTCRRTCCRQTRRTLLANHEPVLRTVLTTKRIHYDERSYLSTVGGYR